MELEPEKLHLASLAVLCIQSSFVILIRYNKIETTVYHCWTMHNTDIVLVRKLVNACCLLHSTIYYLCNSYCYFLKRGRPKLNITRDQIQLFMAENYTARQMAQHFGCSINLIYKKCYAFGIKFRDKYFSGEAVTLQEQISSLHTQFPNGGSQVGYIIVRQLLYPLEHDKLVCNILRCVITIYRGFSF